MLLVLGRQGDDRGSAIVVAIYQGVDLVLAIDNLLILYCSCSVCFALSFLRRSPHNSSGAIESRGDPTYSVEWGQTPQALLAPITNPILCHVMSVYARECQYENMSQ